MKYFFMAVFFLAACGGKEQSSLSSNHNESLRRLLSRQGVLNFVSEKKQYQDFNGDLALKLGWDGFGSGVKANARLRYESSGTLVLQKQLIDENTKIFRDGNGTLEVAPGEEFYARCSFEMGASLEGSGELSLVSVSTSKGVSQNIEVSAISEPQQVIIGDSLKYLEERCKVTFAEKVRDQLKRELDLAIGAQFALGSSRDQHLEALRYVLHGEGYEFIFHLRKWYIAPVTITESPSTLIVSGTITEHKLIKDETYAFNFSFDKEKNLTLINAEVSPRGLSESSHLAQRLAGYFARNCASWHFSEIKRETFTISTQLLESIR